MITSFWITFLVVVAGIILVALPDNDKSIFNFNKNHGPSLHDLFGLLLITPGWGFMAARTILKRKMVLKSIGGRNAALLIITIITGSILIVAGLQVEKDLMMWPGVLMSIFAYTVLFVPAFRKG